VIERNLIDDVGMRMLDYHKSFHTPAERLTVVQNHLPKFLRAAEERFIRGGPVTEGERLILSRGDFPEGTF
jgi:hypothetical protein